MKISIGLCEDIIKTLPIGYYLGHKVTVKLDPAGNDTYINLNDETITISYKAINEMLENAGENCNNEEIIRGLLYHEISHAILTANPNEFAREYSIAGLIPKRKGITDEKKEYMINKWHDIFNIFEDERIETILKNYYLNVNFKKNLILMNGIDPVKEYQTTTDPIQKFYIAVRYRVAASSSILNKIETCINDYARLCNCASFVNTGWKEYVSKILNIFYNFLPEDMQPEKETEDEETDAFEEDENKKSSGSVQFDNGKKLTDKEVENLLKSIAQTVLTDNLPQTDDIKDLFKVKTTNPEAENVSAKIEKILKTATAKRNTQSSGSTGYAGKIDPRLCGNKDYKWWIKKSETGTHKRFTKIHFNLFCDNSGSFNLSKNRMNGLILALRKLKEKNKNFSVTFIHCGYGMRVPDQTDPYLDCSEGSCLLENADEIYKSVQKPDAENINLVVFDGMMYCSTKEFPRFKAFNHPNCVVVSDTDNKVPFSVYAPQARCTFIERNYVGEFEDAVMSQLEKILC